MRDHVALYEIHTEFPQNFKSCDILRTFGHSLRQEGLCEAYHRRHDVAAGGLLRLIANELPVDLEVGNGEPLQMGEAAVPRAEVVQSDLAADVVEAMDALPQPPRRTYAGYHGSRLTLAEAMTEPVRPR